MDIGIQKLKLADVMPGIGGLATQANRLFCRYGNFAYFPTDSSTLNHLNAAISRVNVTFSERQYGKQESRGEFTCI